MRPLLEGQLSCASIFTTQLSPCSLRLGEQSRTLARHFCLDGVEVHVLDGLRSLQRFLISDSTPLARIMARTGGGRVFSPPGTRCGGIAVPRPRPLPRVPRLAALAAPLLLAPG